MLELWVSFIRAVRALDFPNIQLVLGFVAGSVIIPHSHSGPNRRAARGEIQTADSEAVAARFDRQKITVHLMD